MHTFFFRMDSFYSNTYELLVNEVYIISEPDWSKVVHQTGYRIHWSEMYKRQLQIDMPEMTLSMFVWRLHTWSRRDNQPNCIFQTVLMVIVLSCILTGHNIKYACTTNFTTPQLLILPVCSSQYLAPIVYDDIVQVSLILWPGLLYVCVSSVGRAGGRGRGGIP